MCSPLLPPPVSMVVLPPARVMPPQNTVARASTLPSSPAPHLTDPLSAQTCPASAPRLRSNLTLSSVSRKRAPQTTSRPRNDSRPSIVPPVSHSRRFPHSLDALGIISRSPGSAPASCAASRWHRRRIGRGIHWSAGQLRVLRLSPIHKVHCGIQ